MEETDLKRQKIEELLEYIESRLDELEEEKKELSEYQQMDSDRRCLEYTIYTREQSDLNQQLEQMEELRRTDLEESSSHIANQETEFAILNDLERELKEMTAKFTEIANKKSFLVEEQKVLSAKRVKIELILADFSEDTKQHDSKRKSLTDDVERLDNQITGKTHELNTLIPKYEKVILRHSELKSM